MHLTFMLVLVLSRGVSGLQRLVLVALEGGPMSFRDVAELRFRVRAKTGGVGKPDAVRTAMRAVFGRGPVKEEQGFASIYRMMRSLVKRSLVAELLGRRPRFWFKVAWEGDEPRIIDPQGRLLFMGYVRKPARLRIGGALYELYPPRPENKIHHKPRKPRRG
jgi:hypothetical protein